MRDVHHIDAPLQFGVGCACHTSYETSVRALTSPSRTCQSCRVSAKERSSGLKAVRTLTKWTMAQRRHWLTPCTSTCWTSSPVVNSPTWDVHRWLASPSSPSISQTKKSVPIVVWHFPSSANVVGATMCNSTWLFSRGVLTGAAWHECWTSVTGSSRTRARPSRTPFFHAFTV